MQFLIILTGIALLIALITARLNPALALLITSVVTGLLLLMPFDKVMSSVNNGIGSTMSSLVMIPALGGAKDGGCTNQQSAPEAPTMGRIAYGAHHRYSSFLQRRFCYSGAAGIYHCRRTPGRRR